MLKKVHSFQNYLVNAVYAVWCSVSATLVRDNKNFSFFRHVLATSGQNNHPVIHPGNDDQEQCKHSSHQTVVKQQTYVSQKQAENSWKAQENS